MPAARHFSRLPTMALAVTGMVVTPSAAPASAAACDTATNIALNKPATASSVQGVVGTVGAALIGFLIGQQFDGTPIPFLIGTAACAAGSFLLIVLTEPKRLFAPIRIDSEAEIPPSVPEDLG